MLHSVSWNVGDNNTENHNGQMVITTKKNQQLDAIIVSL